MRLNTRTIFTISREHVYIQLQAGNHARNEFIVLSRTRGRGDEEEWGGG